MNELPVLPDSGRSPIHTQKEDTRRGLKSLT